MVKYQLTNQGYMGLGICLGFKASHHRSEMQRFGVNYDQVIAELTRVSLVKNGRLVSKEARLAFNERFPDVLGPSQVHQYKQALGY